MGIHYVGEAGEGQSMRRILDRLGLESVRFREINPDCIDRYVFDGYEARLVKGIDRWEEVLAADFPRARDDIHRFLELMRAADSLQRMAVRGPSVSRVTQALRHAPDLLRAVRAPFSDVLAHYFRDPMLRNVFAGPGGDIGLPPSRASALISILVLNHFLSGGYYPVGGSGAMRDAYVAALRERGAELLRNQVVERIEVLGDGSFAVYTARGDRFLGRSVVSNVDATHTVEMIEGARPNFFVRRKVKNLRPSLGSFCVFIGTDIDLSKTGVTDANIWHYGSNDLDAGYQAAFEGRIPDKPFFFLTAPTLKDPDTVRAPNGHHTVELITFLPPGPFKPWFERPAMKRGEAYEAIKAEVAQRVIAEAERYVPGLGDHAIIQETATPATVWHFVRGREGGIYGPEHTPDQTFLRRVFTSVGVPGLYLAGASVFGAGILTCMSSGMVAARFARRHLERAGQRRFLPVPRALRALGA